MTRKQNIVILLINTTYDTWIWFIHINMHISLYKHCHMNILHVLQWNMYIHAGIHTTIILKL